MKKNLLIKMFCSFSVVSLLSMTSEAFVVHDAFEPAFPDGIECIKEGVDVSGTFGGTKTPDSVIKIVPQTNENNVTRTVISKKEVKSNGEEKELFKNIRFVYITPHIAIPKQSLLGELLGQALDKSVSSLSYDYSEKKKELYEVFTSEKGHKFVRTYECNKL